MRLATDEGKRSKAEDDRPHPKVGAVVVQDGRVLNSAFRGELAPGDHAEFILLERKLRSVDVSGAELFTTLEPCTTRARYKSCADWIIERKVATVVIGMLDPNPRIYAQGLKRLRNHGVRIDFFPANLRDEIRMDNATFIAQFHASPEVSGRVVFNYTHNDGLYTIGHGDYLFETRWSKASDTAIHVYTDNTNVRAVGLALGARLFADVVDASAYDMSSRVQTPQEGEIVVLQNANDIFAAVKVVEVLDRTRTDPVDSLTIEYRINIEGGMSFTDRSHVNFTREKRGAEQRG